MTVLVTVLVSVIGVVGIAIVGLARIALWTLRTRVGQEPYVPTRRYVYREGMATPAERYRAIPGAEARRRAALVRRGLPGQKITAAGVESFPRQPRSFMARRRA